MGALESRIDGFLRDRGVEVSGFAGPERLDGPPSLNPRRTMRGARSIVSLALPMNVKAIEDFLGKRTAVPHNLDQLKQYKSTVTRDQMITDSKASAQLWKRLYLGFEPLSWIQGRFFETRQRRAVRAAGRHRTQDPPSAGRP
jgi:hypothetical protein